MPEGRWNESPLKSLLIKSPLTEEDSGLLSSLPPQHIPASLGSAHWHCHIHSGFPSPAPLAGQGAAAMLETLDCSSVCCKSPCGLCFGALSRDLGVTSCHTAS